MDLCSIMLHLRYMVLQIMRYNFGVVWSFVSSVLKLAPLVLLSSSDNILKIIQSLLFRIMLQSLSGLELLRNFSRENLSFKYATYLIFLINLICLCCVSFIAFLFVTQPVKFWFSHGIFLWALSENQRAGLNLPGFCWDRISCFSLGLHITIRHILSS